MACTTTVQGRPRPSPPFSALQHAPPHSSMPLSDQRRPTRKKEDQTASRPDLLRFFELAGGRAHQRCPRSLVHGSSTKEESRSPCERAARRHLDKPARPRAARQKLWSNSKFLGWIVTHWLHLRSSVFLLLAKSATAKTASCGFRRSFRVLVGSHAPKFPKSAGRKAEKGSHSP